MLDPRALQQLSEIVDLGSFSRAAEALGVTQSTLSRSIQQLEAHIGTAVLRRGRFGAAPTAIGEILAREGRTIRNAVGHANHGINQWRGGVDGQLRIGVGPMFAHSLMPPFVDQCLESNPRLTLRVHTESAQSILASVRNGEIDLALVPANTRYVGDELISETVVHDDIGIYSGQSHPLASRKKVSNEDLASSLWVGSGAMLGPRANTNTVIERLGLTDARIPIDFAGDAAITLHLVSTGKYLAALPNLLMRHLVDGRKFKRLPIEVPNVQRDVAMFCHRDMESHPNVEWFRKQLQMFLARVLNRPVQAGAIKLSRP